MIVERRQAQCLRVARQGVAILGRVLRFYRDDDVK